MARPGGGRGRERGGARGRGPRRDDGGPRAPQGPRAPRGARFDERRRESDDARARDDDEPWTARRADEPTSGGPIVELELGPDLDPDDGAAMGRLDDGRAALVPGGLPGERVRVEAPRPGGSRARLVEVLRASPARVTPTCRHADACGGCAWQHVAYPEQLRRKRAALEALLARATGARVAVEPVLGLEPGPAPLLAGPLPEGADPAAPWGFRTKVHLVLGPGASPADGPVAGHYRRGTQRLLPIVECPVHAPAGQRLALRMRDALARQRVPGTDERAPRGVEVGIARHALVRVGEGSGQTQAVLVTTRERFRGLPEVERDLVSGADAPTGLHLNVNDSDRPFILGPTTRRLHGRERLLEVVRGQRYLVSARAFFQTNARAAALLVDVLLGLVPDDRRPVLDLYSGCGLFSLPLAARGHAVLAVEENAAATADGAMARDRAGLPEAALRFLPERAEVALRRLAEGERRWPHVVVDPPRDGIAPGALRLLLDGLRPERVVYVSCNPEALSRDLAEAGHLGWRAQRVQPVDMFPHTPHVETVALLRRA